MREIKFRAWDKKDKEMLDLNSLEIYDELDKQGFYSLGEVLNNEDWEVMQYLGIKDKNGKEIYEGDIVRGGEKIWSIEYRDGSYDLMIDGKGAPIALVETEQSLEVIGNIYEGCDVCKAKPNKMIPVDDVKNPKCSNCGKELLK